VSQPHDALHPHRQPSGGGWPEPVEDDIPGGVGWPEPRPDDGGGSSDERRPAEPHLAGSPPEDPSLQDAHEPEREREPQPDPGEHPADGPVPPPARARVGAVVLLSAALILLVALDAVLGVVLVRTRGIGEDEQGRRDAIGAARNAARLVLSYDYRRLDKDVQAALATTTGDFRDEYSRTTAALKKDGVPTRYKAVVVSEVSDAAVVAGGRHRAQVLVFVNQLSTSTLSTAPKVTKSRVLMRLVNKDGRWLVEEVDAI